MRPCINPMHVLALTALALLLAACSQYLDRRDSVSLNAGNALATNAATEMVDPWPRDSANRNIAFNGERMQAAVARYRTGKVIQPIGMDTSGSYGQSSSGQAGNSASNTTPLGPQVNQQPVK
jgi:PBP1b-binding outer membrane lipoprotein LpoB